MRSKTVVLVSCLVLLAGPSSAEETVESCRKLTRAFDPLDLPRVTGKKFASFNTGEYRLQDGKVRFGYEPGWILEDNAKEITLLQENLVIATYRKDAPLPPGWDSLKKDHPKECPLPREVMEFSFEEFCDDVLKEDVPTEKDDHTRSIARIGHRSWGGFSHPIGLVLKARWSLERDHPETAVKLVQLARKSFAGNFETRTRGERSTETTLERELEVSVVENTRWRAIKAAHQGVARPKLLALWKLVAETLPETDWREGAKKLVSLYERQVVEDGALVEVPAAELAKRDETAQVAYWMDRLRDETELPWASPSVFGAPAHDKSAAANLLRLGWPAVPRLIARLEDESPTRCMSVYRQHALGSYDLWRVADVCNHLLYSITAAYFVVSENQQLQGSDRAGVARYWKRWWDETGSKGAEKHYLSLLDHAPNTFQRTVGTEGLLRLDRKRFLPILLKRLEGMKADDQSLVLGSLTPHMDKEQEPLLVRLLEDENVGLVLTAAMALRSRCGSERGTEKLLALAKRWKSAADVPDSQQVNLYYLVRFVAGARPISEKLSDALVSLMDSPVADMKAAALAEVWRHPDKKIARELGARLGRTEKLGSWGREGDLAAAGLKRMLRVPGVVDLRDGAEQDREALKALLKKTLASEEKIDWPSLVRQANDEIAKER